MRFPLIRAININAELSQVRLFLPESHAWFDFEGTMRQVAEEGDLAAGHVAYQTKQAERLAETLRSSSSFAQVRAATRIRLSNDIASGDFCSLEALLMATGA